MSALTRREHRGLCPDLLDWLESPFPLLRAFAAHPMRLEDYVEDGHYVVRAELPDIDPQKDVEVTVANGILIIHAERQEKKETHTGQTSTRHLLPARNLAGGRG